VRTINSQWKELREKYDEYFPLYDRFKKYFGYLNTGKQDEIHDIFAYNGGLFAPDEILDSIRIDDAILYRHTLQISLYDFDSEVSVNVLGHIFEHSLNELEEIQSELEGKTVEKTKTRRKKDGVFYTPKYITKYIVDTTIGKLCEEKKNEIGIVEEEYEKDRKGRKKAILTQLNEQLETYRNWLLELTICDPACGSGAFLNQALEFLIAEHTYIDELQAKLLDSAFVFPNIENQILEKNLFGVDINEESVEIAKLSLWLRTARKGRKLTTLNDNIKCGNSLIDDAEIAGEKAFNWQKEFPHIFEKGGFDVVIGNPPYLRIQGLKDAYPKLTNFYDNTYESATGNYDIYVLFIEKSMKLINDKGQISFILPHKFLISEFGEGIRKFLAEQKAVDSLLHFEEHLVFEVTTYTCILNLTKKQNDFLYFKYINPLEINLPFDWSRMDTTNLNSDKWNLMSQTKINLFEKLKKQPFTAKDIFSKIFTGLQTSADSIYLIEGKIENNVLIGYSKSLDKTIEIEKELVKPLLKGQDVSKYNPPKNTYFVIFPYWLENGKAREMTEEEIQKQFPKGYEYLKANETELRNREKGKMDKEGWFLYIYPKSLSSFDQPKIITPEISLGTNMTFDEGVMYHSTTIYSFILKKPSLEVYKFYLSILNSSLMWFYLMNTGTVLRGGYFRFKTKYLFPFPLPTVPQNNQPFIDLANKMLSLNEDFSSKKNRFLGRIKQVFELDKLSRKLESFYTLDFKDFVKELAKKKVVLSLSQQDEWQEYFDNYKKEVSTLHNEIQSTDNQIDNLVFELYGLTEEEIAIVKGLD
jgi:type I restriction-modification system DNA methylase subunit